MFGSWVGKLSSRNLLGSLRIGPTILLALILGSTASPETSFSFIVNTTQVGRGGWNIFKAIHHSVRVPK